VAHIEAERTGTDREGRRRRRETSEA